MGALVEIVDSASHAIKVFTDDRGFYSASGLTPGVYLLRITAASFLPSARENVNLRAGTQRIMNVTLNTLFEAVQAMPRQPGQASDDDWNWTLRSSSNRPILRVLDNPPTIAQSSDNDEEDRDLKASVAFVAGSSGDNFGSPSDMSTAFSVQRSVFTSGVFSLNGNVGYGNGSPAVVRAAYSHRMADGSHPEVAFTMRRFATPDTVLHNGALQALGLSLADRITLGDLVEVAAGSEVQTIQFMGRVTAARPFGSVGLHISPNTLIEYHYATSEPNTRIEKGFDSAPADLSESGPRMSLIGGNPTLERAHHHEISVSRRLGRTKLQAALYKDNIRNTALTGTGEVDADSGEVLPDIYSGTFTYGGRELDTNGMRLVVQRELVSGLTGTVDYSYGGVMDVPSDTAWDSLRPSMRVVRRHALGAKVSGTAPVLKTRWISSYKWTSGDALTPVDMFNASAGQMEPYWNVFIRQPLPGSFFNSGHLEALVEFHNLLAEGYIPVVAQDGHTVYLVQSPRGLRGGLAFTF
jgi:hypothetical protein